MARKRNDPSYVPASNEERILDRLLTNALTFKRVETSLGPRVTFAHPRAMHEFFDRIARLGGHACELGAALFADRVLENDPGRDVRAVLLTQYARVLYDSYNNDRRDVRESEVAHAGSFVGAMIRELPQMILEWVEDMGDGCASCNLNPQPTAVIRGVILSPSLDQRVAAEFWRLSVGSTRFPLRVFSDPGGQAEASMFSQWNRRAFALVFTHASDAAVERFVVHMLAHATEKIVRRYDDKEEKLLEVHLPVSLEERQFVFRSIASYVTPPSRREYVAGLYGIAI